MSSSPHIQSARSYAATQGHVTRVENKRCMALADKITMAVVDRIAGDIIRPGPMPEERECYVMAQELRDYSPALRDLVAAILKVAEDEVMSRNYGVGARS